MWATRCYAESKCHERNTFLTLTYDEQHYPCHGSLNYAHFQLFLKRLRDFNKRKDGEPFRFFMCGEYGENLGRPHYHALLFGFDFVDKRKCNSLYARDALYESEDLNRLWGKGRCTIGEVNYATARYVAAYTLKLHRNMDADDPWYKRVVPETGEIIQLKPEFAQMSLKPGIGLRWLEKYWHEIYTTGNNAVIVNGTKHKVPRYFDEKFRLMEPFLMEDMDYQRVKEAEKYLADSTEERLAIREACAYQKLGFEEEKKR